MRISIRSTVIQLNGAAFRSRRNMKPGTVVARKKVGLLIVLVSLGTWSATLTAGPNVWTSIGPYGGWVRALAVDPKNPGTVYAGGPFESAIFKTMDGGRKWNAVGSGWTRPYVNVLAIDPRNSGTVYAGIDYGGVFKSTDGGITWTNTGLPLADGPVAIDPQDPNILYAASGGAIFKSTDAGTSWNAESQLGIVAGTLIFALAVDPLDHSTVYVATQEGVFNSTNGGTSWSAANSGLAATGADLLAIDPQNWGTLYTASSLRLFKTTDQGKNWSAGGAGAPGWVASLAVDPQNASTLYAGTIGDADFAMPGAVFKSTNVLAIDPQGDGHVYAGIDYGGVFKSTDGGITWTNTGHRLAMRPVAIDPQDPNILYAASGGAIFKSTDAGTSWNAESQLGIVAGTLIFALAVDPLDHSTVYVATQEGVFNSTNGGRHSWTADSGLAATGADLLAIDPRNWGTLYTASSLRLFKTTDQGKNWSAGGAGAPGWVASLAVDPQNASTLYAGTIGDADFAMPGAVFKSTNVLAIDPQELGHRLCGDRLWRRVRGAGWGNRLDQHGTATSRWSRCHRSSGSEHLICCEWRSDFQKHRCGN